MDADVTMAPKPPTPSPEPPTPPPGPPIRGWIGDYALVRELGGGGFGSVYLVRDPKSKVEYAIKGLPPIVRQNREELENVLANFRLVQGLEGHHIAQMRCVIYPKNVVYFHGEDREKLRVEAGDPVIVMSYAPGMTLSKWRKTQPGGRVPHEKAVEIVRQIADALDYAHHANPPIIHRDVKPSNVMIEERADGTFYCRVLDFGLAAEIRTTLGRISMEIRDVCGTRPYMATEQWVGDRQGPGTDQYALAVLYCELVTGSVPFQSAFDTGDVEIMRSAVLARRPDLSEVPRVARKAVARALEKKRNRRYPTCTAFAEALRGTDRNLLLGAACCAGGLALAAVALVSWMRWSQPAPEPSPAPDPSPAPAPNPVHAPASVPLPAPVREPMSVQDPTPVPKRIDDPKPESRSEPPLEPHAHRYGEWRKKCEPTCVDRGFQVRVCTVAGCSLPAAAETNSLPALGHDWSAWSDVVQAKSGVAGVEERQCRRCQLKDSKSIPPLMPDVDRLLQEAKSFAEEGRDKKRSTRERYESWQQCLETTERILQIKPGKREAGRLKDQAENAMTNLREHQSQATPQNTLRGTKNSNGIEPLNNR